MFELAIWKHVVKEYLRKGMTPRQVVDAMHARNMVCYDMVDLVNKCAADLEEEYLQASGWISNKSRDGNN